MASLLSTLYSILLIITTLLLFTNSLGSITSRRALKHPKLQNGFKIEIKHIDHHVKNLTKFERLKRGLARGRQRLHKLNAMALAATATTSSKVHAPVVSGNGEFLMKLSIGTPSRSFSAIMDTGSDLIWTQCKPCKECFDQSTPIFDPEGSSTFTKLSCSDDLCNVLPTSACSTDGCQYLYSYGDSSSTQGILAAETFTFGDSRKDEQVSIGGIAFGCGDDNEGNGFSQGAGLVGLGRGPLSLVSQLNEQKFAYCLTAIDDSKPSTLFMGYLANDYVMKLSKKKKSSKEAVMKTTPLIKNPSQPSFYYLSLEGISVGDTQLSIPKSTFELGDDGSGGVIIDSGTTMSYIEETAFELLKNEFIAQIKQQQQRLVSLSVAADSSESGLDLCFNLPPDTTQVVVPKLTFHFKDADLELPPQNYMIADSVAGFICLAMGSSRGMSIFGNLQQQNFMVLHDLQQETLSFLPAQCADL